MCHQSSGFAAQQVCNNMYGSFVLKIDGVFSLYLHNDIIFYT